MPIHPYKRALRLAVTRFGVNARSAARVLHQALRSADSQPRPDPADLLLQASLLSESQAQQLREALDQTQIDPGAQAANDNKRSAYEVQAERPPGDNHRRRLQEIVEYKVLRQLGEGGMGGVYLAFDEANERLVAIKVLQHHLTRNAALVERFRREAEFSTRLNHPNIVRGFSSGRDPKTGRYFLVMEYVDGPSVQKLLDQHQKLSIGDAVHIACDIAHALEHAQSHNIVHRDVKPENILITRTGIAKLADLGLSKATDQTSNLTATRQGFGTPYYMPYEQAMNARRADGRSDIFALGATLYHMVTGQVPFQGENPVDILERKAEGIYPPASLVNPEVPPVLDEILTKMLAPEPEDRYQTASELIVDLERSGLASPVLSFVDAAAALQDPHVRARVVLAHQATQLDVQAHRQETVPAKRGNVARDRWHLRYRDGKGKLHHVRATTQQICMAIRKGRLDERAVIRRANEPHFRGLESFARFRQELDRRKETKKPTESESADEGLPMEAAEQPSRTWPVVALATIASITLLTVLLYLLLY